MFLPSKQLTKAELKKQVIKEQDKIEARTFFALEPKTLTQTAALALVKKLFF